MKKRAVIVRAGSRSEHNTWAYGSPRSFDVLIAAYEEIPQALKAGVDDFVLIPGTKVSGWSQYFRIRPNVLNQYRSIAFIDDDIVATTLDIDKAFDVGESHNFQIWQPSLSWDSFFSYAITLQNPIFSVRFVNYVEMMCPFFSSEQLRRTLPLFELGLETGIDRFWCRLIPERKRSYGIVDVICVQHGRRVGLLAAQQGFERTHNAYQKKLDEIEANTGVKFHGPVAYGGVSRAGKIINSRATMAVSALVPLQGWRRHVNRNWFYRPILDHCRHNAFRPIDNSPLDVEDISRKILK